MKLSLVALLAIIGIAVGEVVRVPMVRIENRRERLTRTGEWEKYMVAEKILGLRKKFGGSADQPLNNNGDVSYLGKMTLGTPPQEFNLIMDTGSSNLWVTDKNCGKGGGGCSQKCCDEQFFECLLDQCSFACCEHQGCPNKEAVTNNPFAFLKDIDQFADPCAGKNKFDSSASSTYQQDSRKFEIEYGTGSCSGVVGKDIACLGGSASGSAGCTPSVMAFGQATHLAQFFANQKLDGICGLAFKSIAVDHLTPFFDNIEPQLTHKFFTVWLTDAQTGANGGEIVFGDVDSQHCNTQDIHYIPLIEETYWEYQFDSVKFGSYTGNGGHCISDTGTSLLVGPEEDVKGIADVLGATFSDQMGLYTLKCSKIAETTTTIDFVISGRTYSIQPKNYIIPITPGDTEDCILAAQGGSVGADLQWILGDTFLRQFCHIFDPVNKRIGLMPATA